MLPKNFIPTLPFEGFKWKWGCLQCTEGINDPVVLLGVLFRMKKLEGRGLKYSSEEFAQELRDLSADINGAIDIDLAGRTGERNLIRNSGQYWKAVGLIPAKNNRGIIELTDFGRKVATHEISQTEFSAVTIQTFKLPNIGVQSPKECKLWTDNGLTLYPLRILMGVILKLERIDTKQGYITPFELSRVIIPLSGCHATIEDYTNFILWYRRNEINIDAWPNCTPEANDFRIAREYLLFLSNYGYLNLIEGSSRMDERYHFNSLLTDEVDEILSTSVNDASIQRMVELIRSSSVTAEVERKRIQGSIRSNSRPYQAIFRREVLRACERCVITNVTMPEVLEAAHIKPYKYHGEDTIANGFAMRTDIHLLFDGGHLRIDEYGNVELSGKARLDYGATIPPRIVIPNFTNKEFIKWRWDNYNGM